MTNKNKPSVKIVTGSVNKTKIGFTNVFKISQKWQRQYRTNKSIQNSRQAPATAPH
ncbi:hypothetical protein B1no1_18060 [Thermolongibacillus altinsuensis]|nr:hypothetical protein B1no1_18060 [Thermolongibacillus altinsuensis]